MRFHKNAAVDRYLRETQASLDGYWVQLVLPSSRMRNFDRANFTSETIMVQGHDRRAHDTTAAERRTDLTRRARNLSCDEIRHGMGRMHMFIFTFTLGKHNMKILQ
jgi:hypothetical protein